jgi:hypothetical protein
VKDNQYKMAWIELKECLNNDSRVLKSMSSNDRLKGKLEGVRLALTKLEQIERFYDNVV